MTIGSRDVVVVVVVVTMIVVTVMSSPWTVKNTEDGCVYARKKTCVVRRRKRCDHNAKQRRKCVKR